MMIVSLKGSDSLHAFHDPRTDKVELLSSRQPAGGQALPIGSDLVLYSDPEGTLCQIEVSLNDVAMAESLPERPSHCRTALDVEAEVSVSARPTVKFEPSSGVLQLVFEGIEAKTWGRLGDNLIWLALDDDFRLAALVVEGVSRDPGGAGVATWLSKFVED